MRNIKNIISIIILFCLFNCVYCSHFRYATYNWERVGTTGRTVSFFTEQSRRWSYGWYPYRQIGQKMDISSEDSRLRWKWGDGTEDNHIITVTSFDDKEDWVIGSQTITHTYSAGATYTIRMFSCCRIGTLQDSNAHKWYQTEFTVNTNFGSPGVPTRSTKATALPIIYIQGGVSSSFILPTVASDSGQSTTFSYTNPGGGTGQAGTSGLQTKQPGGSGGMQLSASDGRITWTPPNPSSTCDPGKTDLCLLYATQFKMSDGVNFVVLDLLFKVVVDQVGNSNPVFDPPDPPTYDMFIGLELRFDVVATDADNGDHPSIISGNIPNGATLSTGCKEGNTGQTCTREFRWTPGLGQTAVDVCFTANDLNGGNSQGLYCIKIREGAAKLLFLTGIIRDINLNNMPDFDRAAVSNEPAFVKSQIGVDGKPQYDTTNSGGSSTSGKTNFDRWWNTDATYNKQIVHSITLTNAKTTDKRIFTFESSQFFPIDGQLYDEGLSTHNKFFTYEIHSDLTYTEDGGEVFEYSTADDLWIFINGKIVVDLRGIHSTPATASIALDSLQASHGLVKGKTYRVDIFYAHRGTSTTPSLTLQINEAAVCNAISTGITDVNFGKTVGFDAGTDTNKLKMQGQVAINGIQNNNLKLVSSSSSGSSSVWYSEYINNQVTPKRIKFLNGFRCEFGFKVTTSNAAEGFAFVLQDDSQTARGDSGAKLGYDPIPKSLAIEFDMKVDAAYNDPNRQHVSIHTRNSLDPNSADELYSIGQTSAPDAPINELHFTNGTEHHVAIEYVPAYDDNSGGPLLGWIRVYLGTDNDKSVQVVPFVQGQVDGRILRTMFPGNGGYVGFTGSSTSSVPNSIDITYWTFTAVPLSAAATNAIQSPTNVVAGNTGSFNVQARDACGNKISIGGEVSKFTATMGPAAGVVQDIGPPSPNVNVDIIDNDDGTYTFSYDPTVAAPVQIDVKLDSTSISGSPFTFDVESAETSVTKSRFVIEPKLVEKYSNKPTATDGIWVVRFNDDGTIESSNEYDTTITQKVVDLTTFLNAFTGVVAIVVRGNAWNSYPSSTTGDNLETAFNNFGCTGIRSVDQYDSYACIGVKPSNTFVALVEHGTTQRTSRLQKELGTGNLAYYIEARSAGKNHGNQGYIQSYPKQQAQPAAGQDIVLTIMAVDDYDNLKNTIVPDPFEMSFVPSMTIVSNLALNTGFYTGKFKSITALTHSVYVRLSSDLPSSPFSVKVEGSVADPDKTTLTGTGVNQGTVGTTGYFDIHLKDEFNNVVVKDTNAVSATLEKQGTGTVTAQPVGGGTGWDSGSNSYKYQYDVTDSGEYTIYVTITQVQVTSATWKPFINPGNVEPSNCIFVTTPTNVKAGIVASFNIQERDAQGNNLIIGVTPTVGFTGGTIEGTPIVTSLGNGLFQIDFVAENVATYNVDVKINGVSISNSPESFSVTFGDLSDASSIENVVSSVVDTNQFTIRAKDRLGNPRTTGGDDTSFSVDIRTSSDVVPNTIEILPSTSQDYTVNWTSIIAAEYTISISLIDVGPIQGSGTSTVNLLSGPTHFQHVTTNGPGLIGGIQNTVVEFTIQAKDIYDNDRDNSDDAYTLTITPISAAAYSGNVVLTSPGVYTASYTVPAWSLEEQTFTLSLELTSGPAGTTTGEILNIQGTIKEADAETCAILDPIPSIIAGQNSQFNLAATCCDGNPSCNLDSQNYRIEVQGTNSLSNTFVCKRQDAVTGDASCIVNENANDVYEITIKDATKSGDYTVRIFVDGLYEINATRTTPPTLTVSPSSLNAQKSIVTGFPETKVVGNSGSFSVELRDTYSNKITDGNFNVFLDVSDQPNLISAPATKQGNGLYTGTYSSEKINNYNPAVKADTAEVGPLGQRYSITYTYDVPSASKSTVDTTGLNIGLIAGDTFSVYVTVKDQFENIHTSGNVNVTAILTNQNGGYILVNPKFSTSYESVTKRYRIVGRTTVSGYQHKLYIYVNSQLTSNSPYLFDISSTSISDVNSIQNVGLNNVVAGTTVQYQIYARDSFNNPWTGNSLSVVAANFEDTKTCNVVKSDTGVFDVTYSEAFLATTYTFYTTAGATQLGNAPSIIVSHNIPYGGNTKTNGAINNGKIDQINQITFATYDYYDNEITNSSTPSSYYLNFTIGRIDCEEEGDDDSTINAEQATTFSSSIQYQAPNKYVISYNGTEVGEYTVHFTVDGTKMQCNNLPVISLSPGTALASNTLMEGNGLAGGVSGSTLTIKLFLRDRFNNFVSDSNANIVVTNGPGAGPYLTNSVVDDLTIVFVPYQAITKENAHWLVTYKAKLKGDYEFYATLNGAYMSTPTSDKIVITPGPASTFSRLPLSPIETATYSSYIVVTGTDAAGNLVDDNGASAYTLVATHNEKSEPQYKFYGALSYHGAGEYHLTYRGTFAGNYSSVIKVSLDNNVVEQDFQISLKAALCGGQNSLTPYRCPDGTCVASYDQCNSLFTRCAEGEVQCELNDVSDAPVCVSNLALCPCPNGQQRCASGHCDTDCLEPVLCSGDFPYECYRGGLFYDCRKTADDCPTELQCPYGYFVCDGGLTCGTYKTNQTCVDLGNQAADCAYSTCFDITENVCPDGQKKCSSGSCVVSLQDCPTEITCPSGQILCWDRTCKTNIDECAEIGECLDINGKPLVLCPDGSCRSTIDECPTGVTCPTGYILCSHGECVETISKCNSTYTSCPLDKFRCGDGTCVENRLLCPTKITCTSDYPVLCSNNECVRTIDNCPSPIECPDNKVRCPSCDICVDSDETDTSCCSSPTCSEEKPILCPDRISCVENVDNCGEAEPCEFDHPIRCPDGSCRSTMDDCPTVSSCHPNIRCEDGQCAISADTCYGGTDDNSTTVTTDCTNNRIRCPDGSCALSLDVCPSTITCPAYTIRCTDGTCRLSIDECPSISSCPLGTVQCPNPDYGSICVTDINDCPQSIICPSETPVRCMDTSCAATEEDCVKPANETEIITTSKVVCPDGGFETEADICGTPITCPQCAPFKCWDDTCRLHPDDCPPMPKCPDDTPYVCPDGTCVTKIYFCRSVSGRCEDDNPIMCPDNTCVKSAANCACPYFPTDTANSDNEIFCPHGMARCHDSSCRKRSTTCESYSCQPHVPIACDDGMCTSSVADCLNLDTGCSISTPYNCSGACVKNQNECDTLNNNLKDNSPCPDVEIRCPDGSCAGAINQCPESNGCFKGYMRCHDKRCVRRPKDLSRYNPCKTASTSANLCPASRPVRCPRGFCSISKLHCPAPLSSSTLNKCPITTPIRCDDGSCRSSSDHCPVLYPCNAETGTTRCLDGSCRAVEAECPIYDSTSCDLVNNLCCPKRHIRCPNGLCAKLPDNCDDNGNGCANSLDNCFNVTTGCPGNQQRCTTNNRMAGLCVNNIENDCTPLTLSKESNGCDNDKKIKCEFTGKCTTTYANCSHPQTLCSLDTPVRCYNGECVAKASTCFATPYNITCNNVLCADGACVNSLAECTTRQGCSITTPIRCKDGSCKKYASGTTNDDDSCAPVTSCNNGDVLCSDGSCASDAQYCKTSIPNPTCTNDKPHICNDGSCVRFLDECTDANVCPPIQPITCSDGTCRRHINECPKPESRCLNDEYTCFDGTCVPLSEKHQCVKRRVLVNFDENDLSNTNGDLTCGTDKILCSDSTCVTNRHMCEVTTSCKKEQWRCGDGTCSSTQFVNQQPCNSGYTKCSDGICRVTCPAYDGCPISRPYLCKNMQCATGPSQCKPLVEGETNCINNCKRSIKTKHLIYTLSKDASSYINIAFNGSTIVSQLLVPSGSVVKNPNTNIFNTIQILPVGENQINYISNPVDTHRINELQNSGFEITNENPNLNFTSSVLSPAFSCMVDSQVIQPFPMKISFYSLIDLTMDIEYEDICLAKISGSTWVCVDSLEQRRSYSIHSDNNANNWVNGTFSECNENIIYAFVHIPLQPVLPDSRIGDNWFKNNWYIVFPSIIGGGIFIAGLWLLFVRWYSFRKRLHALRVKRDDLKEKVNDAEEFGVREDSDLIMMRNPLGQNIENMKGVMSTNVDDIEMMETNQMRLDVTAEIDQQQQEIELYEQQLQQLRRDVQFNRPRGDTDDNPQLRQQPLAFFEPPPLKATSSFDETDDNNNNNMQSAFSARPKKRNF